MAARIARIAVESGILYPILALIAVTLQGESIYSAYTLADVVRSI